MITLLTDFGAADYFVPAVKGSILSLNPSVPIIDITHEIIEYDVESAAFTLGACYRDFPAGTIHVAVVDPGVGSSRRAIVVRTAQHLFVGPDNGIFSYVYLKEPSARVFAIRRSDLFRQPASSTFHGRDVFGPIAAHLSRGLAAEEVGEEIFDYVRLDLAPPERLPRERIRGRLIQVDRFGNCVTSLRAEDFPPEKAAYHMMKVAGRNITQFSTHFAEAERKTELFAYLGSAGYWEIGLWCDSAATAIDARRGMEVLVEPQWI